MNKSVLTFLLVLPLWFSGYGQIEISENSEAVKEEKKKETQQYASSSEVYFMANWSHSSSLLMENDPPFGDPLEERADEGTLNIWSFGLGVRNRVHKYVSWEGGMSFMRNGESYLFEGADSTYSYNTRYTYIGMPLKVLFTYGESIRFYAGIGLVPQLFVNYRQDIEYVTPEDHTEKETIKTNNGYNSFVLSGVANIGVQLNMGKATSLFVMPEYRYQLTSSYEKQDDYKHFARALGVNLGLTYSF